MKSDTEWEMQVLRWKTIEQASGGSRPSDKGGGGEGGVVGLFGPLKIKGTRAPRAPPLDLPLQATEKPVRVY